VSIVLTPPAERDIAEAMALYDKREAGLGDEFLARVDVLLARIAERAASFPSTHRPFNRAILGLCAYAV
jgi:hypothetical protein